MDSSTQLIEADYGAMAKALTNSPYPKDGKTLDQRSLNGLTGKDFTHSFNEIGSNFIL